jgi:CRP/FNR family transcriptional regulator, cyclic AMP receptor protein
VAARLFGKIKISVTSEQGREAVVALLGARDFFGEGCLIGQPLRLAIAELRAS